MTATEPKEAIPRVELPQEVADADLGGNECQLLIIRHGETVGLSCAIMLLTCLVIAMTRILNAFAGLERETHPSRPRRCVLE